MATAGEAGVPPEATALPGHFELLEADSGAFRFNLKAGNNQTILTSESYRSKAAAQNGIESVKKNAGFDGRYERHTAQDGSPAPT